jgi:pimeloyl-ACP methyl ester carboxylesterase
VVAPPYCTLAVGADRLEYRRVAGDPARPTLVLLHEGLGCVALWRDFPEQLAAATGCGVFLYSRLGYGGSSARALPWPLDYMQQEGRVGLPRILAAAEIGDCVLVGHSDGASIALVNAGAVRAPEVKGLVVIAPHVFTEEVGLISIRAAREAFRFRDLRARLAKYHGANVDGAFSGWSDSWLHPDFAQWNIEGFLPPVKVPVLQLQGTEDQYGSSAQVTAIARQVGGAVETHLLQACKHAPQFEQTEETLRLISGFVARLVPGGSKPHYAAGPSRA